MTADHVHVLLTAEADGDAARKWFKRWLGEAMSAKRPPEGGSVKWVWDRDYFEDVFDYLNRKRAGGRI